jgi:hypothetical protein
LTFDSSNNIGKSQNALIRKGINYINILEKKKINVHSSPFCYLNSWASVPGYSLLKLWDKGFVNFLKLLFINIKSILGIAYLSNYKTIISKLENKNAQNVIVTWCRKEDFDKSDFFYDRYFKTYSKNSKNEIWFLISVDDYLPKNIEKNVIFFYKEKKFFNLFFLLDIIKKLLVKYNFNIYRIVHRLSSSTVFSEIVTDNLLKSILSFNVKNVCLPYEAQPLHNNIFYELKKKGIFTIGYLHSALPPLMTDLIYRKGAPDKLYVHGQGQISILNKHLNWPSNTLEFCKSLRYRVDSKFDMSGLIFLPYDFFDVELYACEIESFFFNSETDSLPLLKIKNHPHKMDSTKHNLLINIIKNLKIKYSNRFCTNSNKKLSIFIGATAAIIEALELEIEAIHIVSDPLFESHSNLIWKNIDVKMLSENCFSYKSSKIGDYISFGNTSDKLSNLLN